jgi:hypothetical protein
MVALAPATCDGPCSEDKKDLHLSTKAVPPISNKRIMAEISFQRFSGNLGRRHGDVPGN